MKQALVISVLCCSLAAISCRRTASEHGPPVFTTNTMACLKETDFASFLGNSNLVYRTDNLGGVLFKSAPGYLTGATLRSKHRGVGLALFESHETALAAVDFRRTNVAAVITRGGHERDGVKNWWFSESQALLSIVQGNLVLEVKDIRQRYSEVEDELWQTATSLRKAAEQTLPRIQQ